MSSPRLELESVPAAGNTDFAIRVTSNNADFGNQLVMLLVSPTPGDGVAIPGIFECPLWVNLGTNLRIFVRSSTSGTAEFPLPLNAVSGGLDVTMQALLIMSPFSEFDHASSRGLSIRLGY
jgi:hypothetical protein